MFWWPSAKLAIVSSRFPLLLAFRLSTCRAEASGHPFARAKDAGEQSSKREVRVTLREIQAKPGRGDFDVFQIGGDGVLKPLRPMWIESELNAVCQLDNKKSSLTAVITAEG